MVAGHAGVRLVLSALVSVSLSDCHDKKEISILGQCDRGMGRGRDRIDSCL